jgi:hypothetical protein
MRIDSLVLSIRSRAFKIWTSQCLDPLFTLTNHHLSLKEELQLETLCSSLLLQGKPLPRHNLSSRRASHLMTHLSSQPNKLKLLRILLVVRATHRAGTFSQQVMIDLNTPSLIMSIRQMHSQSLESHHLPRISTLYQKCLSLTKSQFKHPVVLLQMGTKSRALLFQGLSLTRQSFLTLQECQPLHHH